jgi:glutathione S-transferase
MTSLKPIILYSHAAGPNPWKTAIILEELKLPYENKFMEFTDFKKVDHGPSRSAIHNILPTPT